MDTQRPLYWHQGLFLQPQHFQLLERSNQSLLTPLHRFLEPHFWGVGKVELQNAALGNRSFDLLAGEFLFPDGTYVDLPANAVLEARPFEEHWLEGEKPLPVFIGLKKWNAGGENVTVLEKSSPLTDVTTRFVTSPDADEVRDLHSGGPQGKVRTMKYALKIFWESERERLGDYVLLPLAQLERSGDKIRLSPSFVPPCLSLSGSETLSKTVKEIRDQIASRGRQLEEYKSQRGIQTSDFGTRDMVYLLALRSLNRYIPALYHYLEAQQIHPWVVYGCLRQLIGELSSFSMSVSVLGDPGERVRALPGYDHGNLGNCFSIARSLVTQLLDEITAGPEHVVPLVNDGTYYAAELKPIMFEGRHRFYLVFRTKEDSEAALQSLANFAKLSAREHVPILIARSLPGIALKHLPTPPQELPRRSHSYYFEIDRHHDQWTFVEKNRNVALYWDNAPEDLTVELMVVA